MKEIVNHEIIYNIFKSGNVQKQIDFIQSCPPSPSRDMAASLVDTDDPLGKFMALTSLTQAYCHGANCKLGIEIAQAGHDFARELYKSYGSDGPLLLTTVSIFANSIVNANNHLGRFNETIELSKVRILENHLQSEANSKKSLVFTAFVSMLIYIATLSIQMMQTIYASFSLLFIVMFTFADLAFVVYTYFLLKKEEIKNLAYIDELLKKIENGEALPSLTELKKMKKA